MVSIDRKQSMNKVHKFLKDNGILTTKQDRTTKFHKKSRNNKILHSTTWKKTQGHLTQIQPRAPLLNALIKTHKTNMPITNLHRHTN